MKKAVKGGLEGAGRFVFLFIPSLTSKGLEGAGRLIFLFIPSLTSKGLEGAGRFVFSVYSQLDKQVLYITALTLFQHCAEITKAWFPKALVESAEQIVVTNWHALTL